MKKIQCYLLFEKSASEIVCHIWNYIFLFKMQIVHLDIAEYTVD